MSRLLKFLSLSPRERQFFYEAGLLLLLSNLCIKTISFRHIESFLCARWKDSFRSANEQVADIKLVNLSLLRAANYLPWESLCLSRSIAAFMMLRRRGISAVIFVGAKLEDSLLLAHAWVDTDHGVIGNRDHAFTPLVRIGQKRMQS
jgi:hypothetical protein